MAVFIQKDYFVTRSILTEIKTNSCDYTHDSVPGLHLQCFKACTHRTRRGLPEKIYKLISSTTSVVYIIYTELGKRGVEGGIIL